LLLFKGIHERYPEDCTYETKQTEVHYIYSRRHRKHPHRTTTATDQQQYTFRPRPYWIGCSTRDLNSLHLRLLLLRLGHGDREHAILEASLDLVHLGVLRQTEAPDELAAAALDAVPLVVLVLLLPAALAADDQRPRP
jgi:hypothetical protein